MVRVDHSSVLAVAHAVDALVEIFESDREVSGFLPVGKRLGAADRKVAAFMRVTTGNRTNGAC